MTLEGRGRERRGNRTGQTDDIRMDIRIDGQKRIGRTDEQIFGSRRGW